MSAGKSRAVSAVPTEKNKVTVPDPSLLHSRDGSGSGPTMPYPSPWHHPRRSLHLFSLMISPWQCPQTCARFQCHPHLGCHQSHSATLVRKLLIPPPPWHLLHHQPGCPHFPPGLDGPMNDSGLSSPPFRLDPSHDPKPGTPLSHLLPSLSSFHPGHLTRLTRPGTRHYRTEPQ